MAVLVLDFKGEQYAINCYEDLRFLRMDGVRGRFKVIFEHGNDKERQLCLQLPKFPKDETIREYFIACEWL